MPFSDYSTLLAEDVYFQIEHEGENVTHIDSDGTETAIKALIVRHAPTLMPESPRGVSASVQVIIVNHATYGLTDVEAQTDKLRMKYNLDDAATRDLVIAKATMHNNAFWIIQCR